jgi:hypothetical protein
VLAVDAFSGDSVPVHLLTREAFAVYFQALAIDGVLALHISNHHLDLEPVVRALADEIEKNALRIQTRGSDPGTGASSWMLVSSDAAFLRNAATVAAPAGSPRHVIWTDDFSSLLHVLR